MGFPPRNSSPGEEASSGPPSPPVLPNPAGSQRPRKPVLQAETVVECGAGGLPNKAGRCLLNVGWPNTLGFRDVLSRLLDSGETVLASCSYGFA